MDEQTEVAKKKDNKKKIFKMLFRPKLIIALVILILISGVGIGLKTYFATDGKTTKLGFEDMGELATQTVTATSVKVEDKNRELLGIQIPFTQSKVIYSYDTVIKAGIDFEKVTWTVDETNQKDKKIIVKIPSVEILSNEVKYDSFKVYLEDESIFSPISMEEHNDAMEELQATAEEDAIANGLYDNALANVKTILTAFITQVYNPDEYSIVFSEGV